MLIPLYFLADQDVIYCGLEDDASRQYVRRAPSAVSPRKEKYAFYPLMPKRSASIYSDMRAWSQRVGKQTDRFFFFLANTSNLPNVCALRPRRKVK